MKKPTDLIPNSNNRVGPWIQQTREILSSESTCLENYLILQPKVELLETSVTFLFSYFPLLATSFNATSLKCLKTISSSFPVLLSQSVFPMPIAFYLNPLFYSISLFWKIRINLRLFKLLIPRVLNITSSIYIKHMDIYITFRQLVA